MERPRHPREIEQEYLETVFRLAELVQQRAAILAVQPEVERLHRQLVETGEAMLTADDPSIAERDYLEGIARLQELLEQKRQAKSLLPEIARLHERLAELGGMLGWRPRKPEPRTLDMPPPFEDRMQRVQRQLAEIRSAMA